MPPGMDPSFLFRSPLFSDAENNNLMAQAAAAEKARAIMMMNAAAAVRPPGPLPPPIFPNPSALAALAATSAATTTASSLPQLPPTLNTSVNSTVNTLNPAIFSHYAALHQAALHLDKATPGSTPTPSSPTSLTRPLFPVIPPMRFSPYVVPPLKRSSPSPPQEHRRSSPIVSLSDRAESEASS